MNNQDSRPYSYEHFEAAKLAIAKNQKTYDHRDPEADVGQPLEPVTTGTTRLLF